MALEMELELEGAPADWRAVREALLRTGIVEIDELDTERGLIDVVFEKSGARITSHRFGGWEDDCGNWRRPPRPFVSSEGDHGCDFLVESYLNIRLVNELYDEAVADIEMFLSQLAGLSSAQFVLSFQFEEVYAIRGRVRGFEWFWDAPR